MTGVTGGAWCGGGSCASRDGCGTGGLANGRIGGIPVVESVASPGFADSDGGCIVDGETATVAVVSSREEGDVIADVLISHGLGATVSADDVAGLEPAAQSWGVHVLVPKSDETSAREVLAAADRTPGVAGQCGGD